MIKIIKSKYEGEEPIHHLIGRVYEEINELELYFDEEDSNNIRNNECVAIRLYEDQEELTIIEKEEYICL